MATLEQGSWNPTPNEAAFYHRYDLRELTHPQLFDFITGALLPTENERYTNGNSAEHKLLFLVGGDEMDVSVARDRLGNPIYTVQPQHPKAPEVAEATAAISEFFERGRSNMPEVLSEIADIFFNAATLTELDSERSETYKNWINIIADSLGFTIRDSLLLAALKYNRRLIAVGTKDTVEEDKMIETLITPDAITKKTKIHRPNDQELGEAYRKINLFGNVILRPRLEEIRKTPYMPIPVDY